MTEALKRVKAVLAAEALDPDLEKVIDATARQLAKENKAFAKEMVRKAVSFEKNILTEVQLKKQIIMQMGAKPTPEKIRGLAPRFRQTQKSFIDHLNM